MDSIWRWLDQLAEQVSVRPSIAIAGLISILLVAWGNFVVVRSQSLLRGSGKRASELLTLFAHTVAAVVLFVVSVWIGFSARDLGLGPLRFGRPHGFVLGVLVLAALAVVWFTARGLARHRNEANGVWKVQLTRLLIGTAGGEEFLFRGFLLALWAGTGASNPAIIAVNVVTFGLWHVVGARKNGRLRWSEILGPAIFAGVAVAARLAFDSLLLPWLLHVAINLPGLALDLKKTSRAGRPASRSAMSPRDHRR